jgi:hypothetical protein
MLVEAEGGLGSDDLAAQGRNSTILMAKYHDGGVGEITKV